MPYFMPFLMTDAAAMLRSFVPSLGCPKMRVVSQIICMQLLMNIELLFAMLYALLNHFFQKNSTVCLFKAEM